MINIENGDLSIIEGPFVSRDTKLSVVSERIVASGAVDITANPEYPGYAFSCVRVLDRCFNVSVYFKCDQVFLVELRWLEGASVRKGYDASREDAMKERNDLVRWLDASFKISLDHHDIATDWIEKPWGMFGVFVNIRFVNECYMFVRYS